MDRILVVMRGRITAESVRQRWAREDIAVAGTHEMAICHVMSDGLDGLQDGIRAQQEITVALREALGPRAETVAILVAYDRDGYRVDDCAREWGATIVYP